MVLSYLYLIDFIRKHKRIIFQTQDVIRPKIFYIKNSYITIFSKENFRQTFYLSLIHLLYIIDI